jgi:hypothetical protein
MNARKTVLALLLAAGAASAGAQEETSPLADKTRMEQRVVSEISGILDQFLGPGKSHVTAFMNVEVRRMPGGKGGLRPGQDALQDPADPKAKKDGKEQPSVHAKWLWKDVSKKQKLAILPGFKVAPEISMSDEKKPQPDGKPQPPRQAPAPNGKDEDGDVYVMEVKSTLVSVVLDRSVSDAHAKMVEVMASEVLGLDPDRGDKLNIYKLPLIPAWKALLMAPSVLGTLFRLLLALGFIALILWALSRSAGGLLERWGALPRLREKLAAARGAAPELAADEEEDAPPAKAKKPEAAPAADGKPAEPAPAAAPDEKRFGFVNKQNVAVLSELLERCDKKDAAPLVGMLEPAVAAQVLNRMAPAKRLEILWSLSWAATLPPQTVQEMHASWKERLDNAFGGTEAVADLLGAADPDFQAAFLARLQASAPEVAERVKRAIVRFEDLIELKDSDLVAVSQTATFQDWAKALHGLPTGYSVRLMNVLPEASRDALQQWVKLTVAPNGQSAQARGRILKAARALEREGRISLKKATETILVGAGGA